jgi:hypothetical protein
VQTPDAGSMHDPRISSTLRQLTDRGEDPVPPRWRWDVVRVEASGRLVLPAAARTALDATDQATPVYGVETASLCCCAHRW